MFTVWRNLHLIQAETKANDIYIQYTEYIYHEAQVPDQEREQGCTLRGWRKFVCLECFLSHQGQGASLGQRRDNSGPRRNFNLAQVQ